MSTSRVAQELRWRKLPDLQPDESMWLPIFGRQCESGRDSASAERAPAKSWPARTARVAKAGLRAARRCALVAAEYFARLCSTQSIRPIVAMNHLNIVDSRHAVT